MAGDADQVDQNTDRPGVDQPGTGPPAAPPAPTAPAPTPPGPIVSPPAATVPPPEPVVPPPGAVPLPGVPFPVAAPPPQARRVQVGRRARILVIAGLAVLVLALGVAVVSALSSDPALTYDGEDIARPERTLALAEESLRGIVEDRHGAANDHTRCYFSLREGESSDVGDALRCGPVLFVDGDADEPYLTFPLQASRGEDDAIRLVAAERPERSTPGRLRQGEELRRPDGESPPDGSGGLEPPPPPRAEPGLIEAGGLHGVGWEAPDGDAVIGSFNVSYEIEEIAQPARVGRGDDARRPAEGERFLAARVRVDVGFAPSPAANMSPSVEAAVEVDDAEPVPVPEALRASWARTDLLVSVPEGAERVDLVVTDVGVEQRLSLLTGEPGPDNVQVLRRTHLNQVLDVQGNLTFTASAPGYVSVSSSVTVDVMRAHLLWFNEDGSAHAPGPDRAWLVMTANCTWGPELPADANTCIEPPLWTLTMPDGAVIPAGDIRPDPETYIVVFDVPANFTQGTVTIGGSYTARDGVTIDLGASRLEVPINIPAG